jgi:hypothetical protein
MEDLVAKMLLEGSIATNPQSIDEVIKLEKALRSGSTRRRASACRYLFLSSLDRGERSRRLFAQTLGRHLEWRIDMAMRTRAFEGSMERRSSSTKELRKLCRLEAMPEPPPIPPAPRHGLMEEIGRELAAFIERNYPPQLPSPACIGLGEVWVKVWKVCRDAVKHSHRG